MTTNRVSSGIAAEEDLLRHPVALYLAGLGSTQSRRAMTQALEALALLLTGRSRDIYAVPWHTLRVQHTTLLATRLAQHCAPATVRHRLVALRGILKACWQLNLIDEGAYRAAINLAPVQGEPSSPVRALELPELAALLAVCKEDATLAGTRDYALIALLYNAGLRRSEIVALDWADLDPTGRVAIQQSKGRNVRMVYLSAAVADALTTWQAASAATSGPIFRAISKAKQVQDRRLTDQAVWYLLEKRANQAGIPPVRPDDIRRTSISTLLDQGVDLLTVQAIAGHASSTTTSRYDRRDERAKRAAGQGMRLPE